ncbi:SigE family RNA polymerase sigma factor [Embleya scabrispora]|uniref:SigE family RNA polymerase sigma factor n=1 Tax=Embleya scabrispora TaxID=159449 RepID=A0A1T3NNG9_9ACTN|nr:SigE family RNA polymerase sigma factor [Embleya scabrispora]OPC78255.1 SigE family RNA polymerase sigma factor [Embleya scabrispora]
MSRSMAADFEEFAHARSGQLLRTACLLTGDWHLAEDLVQETFGKLFPVWRRVRVMEAPMAYAHTTLVRTYLSARRLRRWSERPAGDVPDRQSPDGADIELRLTLLEGLDRLSPNDRAVLVLRYWEDYSIKDTADILRIAPGNVPVRAKRALTRLRALLGNELRDLATTC